MTNFVLNGYRWQVEVVPPDSPLLIDRTNRRRVATTDPETGMIYVSSYLDDGFRTRVLIHEIGHAALLSFSLLDDIHRVVPREYWIDAEEWICNLIADYGLDIFRAAYSVVGNVAWMYIPQRLDKMMRGR